MVLSAQATDVSVNKATAPLFTIADTPREDAGAGRGAAAPTTSRPSASYRTKAKNVIALSQLLVEQHGGTGAATTARRSRRCPASGARPPMWCSNVAFGQPTIAVDTHIFRVANRTGLAPGKTPLEVEARAREDRARRAIKRDAHHWLILHGRYVCIARKPRCARCVGARALRSIREQNAGRRVSRSPSTSFMP